MTIHCKIAPFIFAAGLSRRFSKKGDNKLLFPYKNKPLLLHSVEKILACDGFDTVTIIIGHQGHNIQEMLEKNIPNRKRGRLSFLYNPHFNQGFSTSLRLALASCDHDISHIAIFLGDMPDIDPTLINHILTQVKNKATNDGQIKAATIPTYHGKWGHPVILHRKIFSTLQNIGGDKGARDILTNIYHTAPHDIDQIECEDKNILKDIDRIEDI
jgi:molybdenum cofactor cytidylyltransferase